MTDRGSHRPRVLVIGGGVSGLVAARELARTSNVVLVEAATETGGKIRTVEFRGNPLDVGPDVFITRNPAAAALARELGLGDELLAPSASAAAVYVRGAPRPFPAGLALGIPTNFIALWRSGIISRRGVVRAVTDLVPRGLVVPPGFGNAAEGGPDRSIAEIVAPRLGGEVLDELVGPLLGGINAGDVRSLSFEATAPDLARALVGRRRLSPALRNFVAKRPDPAHPPAPIFLGLREGLASLTAALATECSKLDVVIERGQRVEGLSRAEEGGWRAVVGGRPEPFDGVVSAVPADEAARLVADAAPHLSAELTAIPYSGVVTVTMAFPVAALGAQATGLPGSGVLVPRGEALATALTYTSTKWPRSARPGEIVIRASAGRYGDERALRLDDDELVGRLRQEITAVTGIAEAPIGIHVERFPNSFPQYVVGHLARVARIEAQAAALGSLALIGAWARGIGMPACIEGAKRQAASLQAALSR